MDETGQTATVSLPMAWPMFPDVPLQYATNITVQPGEHEFIVSFFAAYAPIIIGSTEAQKAELAKLGVIPVTCLARLVIARGRMPDFVRVCSDALAVPVVSVPTTGEQG